MEKTTKRTTEDVYPKKVYASQLITIYDLMEFKKQLLDELLLTLKAQKIMPSNKWMKSHEVRRMLKISPGTLQTLKASGVIPFSKIGGVHFYDYEEIERMLKDRKVS